MNSDSYILLPIPRHLEWLPGAAFSLPENGEIRLVGPDPQALRPLGLALQEALLRWAGREWPLTAGPAGPAAGQIALALLPGAAPHPQGYSLNIRPEGVELQAETPAGLFYALQTLRQLLQQRGAELPAARIRDWPDFPVRGVMLDISRDRVPTMETLFELVDRLASWKINQFQLYTEHTFAYRQHSEVWAHASPLTGEQILALDAFCRERFIELVPNQNVFGHMERWLKHARYRELAECPDGAETRWGYMPAFSLNPGDPASLALGSGLLDELLPHFSSRQVNVGCDETIDLGLGRSKAAVEQRGVGPVYLDFLLKIYHDVRRRGYTMQFWGDILMEHPELAPQVPRDAIALEWGYEAEHPFEEHGAIFAASGLPFYVCPGTSSWNSVAGRTDNALGNLRSAAQNGLRFGAVGYLITDWGDNGHWQPLPVSYLGFACGAALAWNSAPANAMDARAWLTAALDRFAFDDPAGVLGELAYDLGNIYQAPGIPIHNNSVLFRLLQTSPDDVRRWLVTHPTPLDLPERWQATEQRLAGLAEKLAAARPAQSLVADEFGWCIDLLRHACRRALWITGQPGVQSAPVEQAAPVDLAASLEQEAETLLERYRALWLQRCRPGGLEDSAARLEKMRRDYC